MRAAFGRVETIEVGGRRGLDPADQEPGRRQRGPADAAAGGRRRGGSTSGSALNDRIADGRDVSWIWDADFELLAGARAAGRLRRHAGAGDGAAAEVRRLADGGDRGRAGDRGLARPRASPRRPSASSPSPPTPPCSSCASCSPTAAWPRSSGDERECGRRAAGGTGIWHDVECGAYAADLPLWEELAARPAGRSSSSAAAPAGSRSTSPAAATAVVGLDVDPALRRRAATSAPTGLPVEAVPPTRATSTSVEQFALVLAPMQLLQLLGGPERAASRCLRCVAATCARAACSPPRSSRRCPSPDDGPPPLPDVREVDGWVYSSLPLEAALDAGQIVVRRLRQTVSPAGDAERGDDEVRLATFRAETLEAEAPAAGLRPAGAREIAATDVHVGSTVVLLEEARDGAARPRPLPRADEHLRRPRQHPLPAAALRVARDRLRPRRRRARRGGRPRRPRPLLPRRRPGPRPARRRRRHGRDASARRSPRRSTTAPSCSPSAAATSCSATATSSARRGCPGSASPTWRRCASRARA